MDEVPGPTLRRCSAWILHSAGSVATATAALAFATMPSSVSGLAALIASLVSSKATQSGSLSSISPAWSTACMLTTCWAQCWISSASGSLTAVDDALAAGAITKAAVLPSTARRESLAISLPSPRYRAPTTGRCPRCWHRCIVRRVGGVLAVPVKTNDAFALEFFIDTEHPTSQYL